MKLIHLILLIISIFFINFIFDYNNNYIIELFKDKNQIIYS